MSDDKQDQFNQHQQVFPSTGETTSDGLSTNRGDEYPIDKRSAGSNEITAEAQKRVVSSRKIEANRRNARKSPGPKTATGKKRVSRNAIQHGFYSKWLLVQHQDGEESQAECDELYASIVQHFQPADWREKDLVDKIAAGSWRVRRVIRHESGQISLALAEHSYELQQPKADSAEEPGSIPARSPEMDAMTDHLFFTSEGMENQLRYEAMINRQLNQAIAELERLQAARKQKPVA